MTADPQADILLAALPAIFQDQAKALRPYLAAFQALLIGRGDCADPGLEEIIGGIHDLDEIYMAGLHRYGEAGPTLPAGRRAPDEFLDWLAGWVALQPVEPQPPGKMRELIAKAISLYRQRGTVAGMIDLLECYTGIKPVIVEFSSPYIVGTNSFVGRDVAIGGRPNHFRVTLKTDKSGAGLEALKRTARAVIDAEKPAHTTYQLETRAE